MAAANTKSIEALRKFLNKKRRKTSKHPTAISLFSGCGLSDYGYELAGFRFAVQVEKNPVRSAIGGDNFPHSNWITGEVSESIDAILKSFPKRRRLDLLVATPPCQGLSSSNPSRGKRNSEQAQNHESKNQLLLDVVPIAETLKPRVIIAENVRQVLTHKVESNGRMVRLVDKLSAALPDYEMFVGLVNVADYGVPQHRVRAIMVAVRRSEKWLKQLGDADLRPWPRPTHVEGRPNGQPSWITIRQWLRGMNYEQLDSSSPENAVGKHDLHFVPDYDSDRHLLINDIPKYTGFSAYENNVCPSCKRKKVPLETACCPWCDSVMRNRPIVEDEDGAARLVNGFKTSYRRMHADRPAPTVTTNSSHVGSDLKIHPWENRVLSILECADLQTVPRSFDWSRAFDDGRRYLVRNLVGEAFPPYPTFLHGMLLCELLANKKVSKSRFASR